jgi:hypothetical protein
MNPPLFQVIIQSFDDTSFLHHYHMNCRSDVSLLSQKHLMRLYVLASHVMSWYVNNASRMYQWSFSAFIEISLSKSNCNWKSFVFYKSYNLFLLSSEGLNSIFKNGLYRLILNNREHIPAYYIVIVPFTYSPHSNPISEDVSFNLFLSIFFYHCPLHRNMIILLKCHDNLHCLQFHPLQKNMLG